ncbi:LacI family DNA-binding transcriptional regulator [Senegalia massiliensis]|uniref:LacI family transcriptional regulator n=1 Tax=Senegalia massiliensis TaxID=1720316 RepID=A0A845QW07_9CLOT|nr:LacI family DNA-binding transcriptional regulator [Senegalia massiliensis]NBI07107.1 LacI family transcriptional regulator [Senegalia massiliensis]
MTIKKIAQLANVSTATVSKVINGKDKYISEATKLKILKIVEQEGYVPNGIAKSLKIKKTKTIGIIIPDVMNLFFSELARGVEDAAEKRGYTVILCNSDNKESKEEKYIQMLQEKKVDGIIITAPENRTHQSIKIQDIPLVLVDRDIGTQTDQKIGRITVDNRDGAYKATKYLIENGCREIGMISSNYKNKPSADRIKGYEKALDESNINIEQNKIFLENYTIESGYNGAKKILKETEVDGIFCGNDLIAIGAIKALREKDIRIPEQVKIIGFDDIQISQYMDPPLTTIRQPIYQMGEESVKMLISLIKNKGKNLEKVLQTKLIQRGSA